MSDKNNNGSMTINGNKNQEQNHQFWKHSQPDQTRLVNKKGDQKVY